MFEATTYAASTRRVLVQTPNAASLTVRSGHMTPQLSTAPSIMLHATTCGTHMRVHTSLFQLFQTLCTCGYTNSRCTHTPLAVTSSKHQNAASLTVRSGHITPQLSTAPSIMPHATTCGTHMRVHTSLFQLFQTLRTCGYTYSPCTPTPLVATLSKHPMQHHSPSAVAT
jgi:hypothetical protein